MLSKRDDELIVKQSVQVEFPQVLRQYCLLWGHMYGRYCIKKSNNDHLHHIIIPQFSIIVFKIKSSLFSVV